MIAKELYEKDFFEWAMKNAELLRAGRLEDADLEHIAEEIEDMAKSQRRELYNRLRVLLAHLLKWRLQRKPEQESRRWRATINEQRRELDALLEDMPSLRGAVEERLGKAYRVARGSAADETGLPQSEFPEACPFTLDQILDFEYFPE